MGSVAVWSAYAAAYNANSDVSRTNEAYLFAKIPSFSPS